MTKKLEEILDLPDDEEDSKIIDETFKDASDAANNGDLVSLDNALNEISDPEIANYLDIERHDKAMDEISNMAKDAFTDVMDLAMSMEPKNAGSVLETGPEFLRMMLDARKSKMDARLKLKRLQIDQKRLDMKQENNDDDVIEGKGVSLSIGDMMEMLKKAESDK
ncbi:MAG: hypothetical protein WC284_13650 [Candidimonas sp.]